MDIFSEFQTYFKTELTFEGETKNVKKIGRWIYYHDVDEMNDPPYNRSIVTYGQDTLIIDLPFYCLKEEYQYYLSHSLPLADALIGATAVVICLSLLPANLNQYQFYRM